MARKTDLQFVVHDEIEIDPAEVGPIMDAIMSAMTATLKDRLGYIDIPFPDIADAAAHTPVPTRNVPLGFVPDV